MAIALRRWLGFACLITVFAGGRPTDVRAAEIWVAPTSQQDMGGMEIASNGFWPVTPAGAVRLAWAIPDDLGTFQSAKVVLIPGAGSPGPVLTWYVCTSRANEVVSANCAGPFTTRFTTTANQLQEIDLGGALSEHLGKVGFSYVSVLAFTTPTTTTDHIVGLRFAYAPKAPSGVPTLASNTFTGTQTAPAFVGDGAGLTNLPVPAGVATLGNNTFAGIQSAPLFVGDGTGLTGVAGLAANAFASTQTIQSGNLNLLTGNVDLRASTATGGNITKFGQLFLHNFGTANTFVGLMTGNTTMTGTGNTGAGYQVMSLNGIGFSNTAVGLRALYQNTSGNANTSLGVDTLFSNTSGFNNVAIGLGALYLNISGSYNTAIGRNSLYSITGSENVAVGNQAGAAATGSQNIYLGADVIGVAGESNTMYLGLEGLQTKTFIAGIRGRATLNANAIPVMIDSAGQLGTVSSSRRFKEDIRDMADASRRLMQLRPVTFRYTQAYIDGGKPIQYGLIAEEVAEVFPDLAVRGADGRVETVHYETLNVLLLNEVQKQQQRIDLLEQRLNELLGERETDGRTAPSSHARR